MSAHSGNYHMNVDWKYKFKKTLQMGRRGSSKDSRVRGMSSVGLLERNLAATIMKEVFFRKDKVESSHSISSPSF